MNDSSESVNLGPITVGELLEMCGAVDPHSVTVLVRLEPLDPYDPPPVLPVEYAFATTHRNGLTEITLDVSK